jgi:drug/metabolite transporter (DMT)-like permease
MVFHVDPAHLVLMRFGWSALAFLPFLWRLRPAGWERRDVVRVVAASVAGVAGYNVPVAYGSQWVPAGIAGLLIATEPIWIVLISILVQGEAWSPRLLAGLALAGTGVGLLLGPARLPTVAGRSFVVGAGLLLLGAVMWAVYTILIAPLSRRHGALTCAAVTGVIGVLPLLGFWDAQVAATVARLDARGWSVVAFLAVVSTMVAVALWNFGLGRLGSQRAGLFLYLIPLVSVAGGALLLGERVTPTILAGGALVVAGVATAQRGPDGPDQHEGR